MTITPCPHPLIERAYADMALPLESGGTTPMGTYIPREEGDFLYSLMREYRPALTVEIGMANGLSSLFICAAHADNGIGGRHIAIDPFQASDWNNVGVGLVRQAGYGDMVRLIELPSHQALPDLEREGVKPQLIFIDGAHQTDYVFTDAMCSDRILEVGGLLVFDDSDWQAIRPVTRYFVTNRAYEPAHPEVVIEPPPGRLSPALRFLRQIPFFRSRFKPDIAQLPEELGILGRCVALRKLKDDDRDSQDRELHRPF